MYRNMSIVLACVMGMFALGALMLGDWCMALAYGSATAAWWFNVVVLDKYEPYSDCAPVNKIERRVHHAV